MLKITIRREGEGTVLELEGKLAGPWVDELANCFRGEKIRNAKLFVDLRNVSFIDSAGKSLLQSLHREGATLAGKGCLTRAIIEQVTGESSEGKGCSHSATNTNGTKIVVTLIALLLGGVSAQAQQNQPLKLTLHDAVVLALKQNPRSLIAEFQAKQTAQEQALQFAGLLPTVTGSVSESRQRENLEALFGRSVAGFPTVIGPFDVFAVGTQFTVPILNLSTVRSWQASKYDTAAARDSAKVTREQVALMVTTEYLNILRASADVRAADTRVDLAQALYDQADDLQKNGAGTGIDTLRANVELQNEKQRELAAVTDHDVAIFQLQRLLGVDPSQTIELTDEMSFFETPAISVEESLEKAWQSRPEMHQINESVRAAESRKSAAWDMHLPTLDANGFWEEQGLHPGTVIPVYQYTAEVKVPIFSGNRTHAEVREADLEIQKLKQQRLDLRNQIAVEVRTANAQLESARKQVEVANQGMELAKEEVQQARDRFAAGVADNVEVVQAQNALSRASDNQITALYQYNASRANLAHAVGQMEALYTK